MLVPKTLSADIKCIPCATKPSIDVDVLYLPC